MQKSEIQSIDYNVLQVANLVATIKFYTEMLGTDHSSFQPPTGGASVPIFAFRIVKDQFA